MILRAVTLASVAAVTLYAAGFWHPEPAKAAETASFCGPAAGQACEGPNEAMVFLQGDKDVLSGWGNIGSQSGLPLMKITSDGGALNMFIDLSNGFATITPAGPPNKQTTFNGITITIPGYQFTDLVFDTQLTPVSGQTLDSFTTTGYLNGNVIPPVGGLSDKADQDAEYSITAIGGTFDKVDILAATGFDEIKHIEVSGVCQTQANGTCDPVVIQTPEPASLALLGVGLLGLGVTTFRRRRA